MCVAIAKPADVRLTKRRLAAAMNQNPDGAGFAWYDADSEMVREQKGFWSLPKLWKAYREHEHQNVLLHFRAATHGAKCNDNCHPFRVADNVVMAHNGVISDYLPIGKDDRSDTRIFAEELLQPILNKAMDPVAFISMPQVLKLLREMVGFWNKLVFLTPNGFLFVNEAKGDWVGGAWYSSGNPEWKTWSQMEDDTSIYYAGRGYRKTKVRDSRSSKSYETSPKYGTPEYEEYWRNRGFHRENGDIDGAWVENDDETELSAEDLAKEDEAAQGKGVGPQSNGSRPRITNPLDLGITGPGLTREDHKHPAGTHIHDHPHAIGSRAIDYAQGRLQLPMGEPTGEDQAPMHGWQVWLAAQGDLTDRESAAFKKLEDQIDIIEHNRKVVEKGLAAAPEGSEIQRQLTNAVRDLDERERLAYELAQGGM